MSRAPEEHGVAEWFGFAAAWAVFLVTHAVPARPPVRARLVARLGERGYLLAYVAVSLLALGWLIAEALAAPRVVLWWTEPWMLWMSMLAMTAVCLLIAFAVAAPNPLSFGGANPARFDPERPGIAGVARHPLLWALALWAGAHLLANGEVALALLFGSFAGFALLGMGIIDRRQRRRMGRAAWAALAARTSMLPGAALVSGRWRPRGRIDRRRLAAGIALWLGLLWLHPVVIGVPTLPW
jgi:uncharacterized membrane protein